jgi:glutathione peroxidase-family protein
MSETQYEGIDSYIEVHEKLEEIAEIKEKIVEKFDDNFEIIENLVINLKKTPIDSLLESIDSTREQLNVIKKNFKSFLDQLIREKEKNA